MAKAVITVGYYQYVVDVEAAAKIMEIVSGAERYATTYVRADEKTGAAAYTAHHVWADDEQTTTSLVVLSDALYRTAKMRCRPEQN